jgi:hypothetical protein
MTSMSEMVGQNGSTLGVGITGHRALTAVDGLAEAIDGVLDQIERAWPNRPLTAISPLAEGSDRLVVRLILARPNAKLIVPLPMTEEEYLSDFASASSRAEFFSLLAQADTIIRFPPAPTRPAAYETAGRYIIDHCQVLVALWNGEPPQGKGGTGAVVAWARSRQRALAWIYANNGAPAPTPGRPSNGHEAITYENFPL